MKDRSLTFGQMSLHLSAKSTYLPESQPGPIPSGKPDCPTTGPSGQDRRLAKVFRRQGKGWDWRMSGTCGRSTTS